MDSRTKSSPTAPDSTTAAAREGQVGTKGRLPPRKTGEDKMSEDQALAARNPDMAERAMRLRRLTAEMLARLTPQEWDRTMQMHLAQARGPVRNAMLLFDMTAMLLRAWQLNQTEGGSMTHPTKADGTRTREAR